MRGKRKRRRRWGGCLRLGEEGGRVEQCYEWIESLTPPTHWIVCHRLLRLYVEWEELAESSWIPESLRHVVWLAEQNPHSGEEQTWLFSPLNWNFLPTREEVVQSLYCLAKVVKEFAGCLGISHLFLKALSLHTFHCFGHVKRISTSQFFDP